MKLKGTVLIADGERDSVHEIICKNGVKFKTTVPVISSDDHRLVIGEANLFWDDFNLKAKIHIIDQKLLDNGTDVYREIEAMNKLWKLSNRKLNFFPSVVGVIKERAENGIILECEINAISIGFNGNADKRIKGLEDDSDD